MDPSPYSTVFMDNSPIKMDIYNGENTGKYFDIKGIIPGESYLISCEDYLITVETNGDTLFGRSPFEITALTNDDLIVHINSDEGNCGLDSEYTQSSIECVSCLPENNCINSNQYTYDYYSYCSTNDIITLEMPDSYFCYSYDIKVKNSDLYLYIECPVPELTDVDSIVITNSITNNKSQICWTY